MYAIYNAYMYIHTLNVDLRPRAPPFTIPPHTDGARRWLRLRAAGLHFHRQTKL